MAVSLRIVGAVYDALRRYHLDPACQRERISYVFGRTIHGPRELEPILWLTRRSSSVTTATSRSRAATSPSTSVS